MKYFLIVLVIFLVALQLSCHGERTGNPAIATETKENETVIPGADSKKPALSTQAVLDSHRELIGLIKQYDTKMSATEDVYYIQQVNMGIPDGENWLVAWGEIAEDSNNKNSWIIRIYIINNYEINRMYTSNAFLALDTKYRVSFDLLEGIEGKRIGVSSAAIWDYNQDGFDEVLSFFFGGMFNDSFTITGYDPIADELKNYCDIPFAIKNTETGPLPVKFLTYDGVYGFEIYTAYYDEPDQVFCYYLPEELKYVSLEAYTP
jgi:hypothetical protein